MTTLEHHDIANRAHVHKLHARAVGLIGVLFLTVTGAAPMSAMLGNVPFAAGFGVGIHVPAAFLLATIVLTIFSVGYAAMARKVSAVGGFYSFISRGIGREVGLGAGLASLMSYSVFEASLNGLFAYFANAWIAAHLGINIPWLYLAFFAIILAGILSYFDVKISVAVLGVALVLEVLMLAIFDIGIFTASSGTHIEGEALNLFHVFTPVPAQTVGTVQITAGAAAVGIFMAFWSWVGFEMAPNYAEESRDPKRIVPLSLYLSVVGLGLFYIITSWAAVSAYPTEGDMLAKAFTDSGNMFLSPIQEHVGTWAKELMSLLILTSSFACGMAFHNTAARYIYSLGREGVLPGAVGRTHPVYHSPHVASVTQSCLAALWVVLFAAFYGANDPNAQAYLGVYTLFAILGTMLLLILQAVVSIAILLYFRRHHAEDAGLFSTVIAPIIAFLAQVYLVYLLIVNLETFGGTGGFGSHIPWIGAAIIVIGVIWGIILKATGSKAYGDIGHLYMDS